MMPIETLLGRLEGVKRCGERRWMSRCPAHKDRTPSLSIAALPDGRILLFDFGGCSIESIMESLGLTFGDICPPKALAHHLDRVSLAGSHAHAARDAMKVLAGEVRIVQLAAEDLAAGRDLTPKQRERMFEAALRIRGAARVV